MLGALARPQAAGFGVEFYPTLFEKAAALLHGLASTQGMKDGNKRTAWAVAATFLEINGHPLKEPLDEDVAEALVMDVALSKYDVPEIAMRLLDFFE